MMEYMQTMIGWTLQLSIQVRIHARLGLLLSFLVTIHARVIDLLYWEPIDSVEFSHYTSHFSVSNNRFCYISSWRSNTFRYLCLCFFLLFLQLTELPSFIRRHIYDGEGQYDLPMMWRDRLNRPFCIFQATIIQVLERRCSTLR